MSQSVNVSFVGSYGKQFGHEVYTTSMSFKSLGGFLKVFPEVQRKVKPSKVRQISNYIYNALDESHLAFFSAVTVTCRGDIHYDTATSTIVIDVNAVLSINDGQHRISAIQRCINDLSKQIKKSEDEEMKQRLQMNLDTLESMTLPVVIFANMEESHEGQLFHDLNNLATKPPKSVSLKFDENDLYNKLAKELAVENEWLSLYGVEMTKTILRSDGDKLIALSTLRNMISYILSGQDVDKKNTLSTETYEDFKKEVSGVLDLIFTALPSDITDRSKYVIGTAAVLQGIGKYIHYLMKESGFPDWREQISKLSNVDWTHQNRVWDGNGGTYDAVKRRVTFSGTHGAVKGVSKALMECCGVYIDTPINDSSAV